MRQIIDTVKGGAHAPSDCFVNPTFQQIVGTTSKGGTAFEGVMTFGNLREPGVALQGRVYRKADELLIVGHYDVTEFAWLNNELAQSNREVNTLHRALIQEKRRLAEERKIMREDGTNKAPLVGLPCFLFCGSHTLTFVFIFVLPPVLEERSGGGDLVRQPLEGWLPRGSFVFFVDLGRRGVTTSSCKRRWRQGTKVQLFLFFLFRAAQGYSIDVHVGPLLSPIFRQPSVVFPTGRFVFTTGQGILFHIANIGFNHSLVFFFFPPAGDRLQMEVSTPLGKLRVKKRLTCRTAEHGGFQIVEDNFSGEAPKILQGVHDAPIEIFFPLGQAELDVTEATETQHSHQHRYAA